MNEALTELALWVLAAIQPAALVFVRVGAVMATLPVLGEQSVPIRVRLALTIVFTLVVFPTVAETTAVAEPDLFNWVSQMLPEVLTGLIFGLALRLFVLSLQIAGTIAAQSTSLSQIFGGSTGVDPQPAMGHVLTVSGLALIALLGFHVQAAQYLVLSYEIIPLGEIPSPNLIAEAGVNEVSRAFSLAFVLSAPFLLASLAYNVTLGVINRAMPQLMVAFVGAPAITAGGLILLMFAAPIMLGIWAEEVGAFLRDPFASELP